MDIPIVDMLIHTRGELSDEQVQALEADFTSDQCVVSFHRNHHEHLFTLAYNPTCFTSQMAFDKLQHQQIDAHMVGL